MFSIAAVQRRRVSVLVRDLLPLGGAERIALNLIAEQVSRGNAVDLVLLYEPEDVVATVPAGARVIKLNAPRTRQAVGPLVTYLKSERPHTVLAQMWPNTTLAIIANALAGSPARVIISDHNPLSIQYAEWGRLHGLFLRATTSLTYRFASARVAVSRGVAKDIASLSMLPKAAFDVIYNPISPAPATVEGRLQAEACWGKSAGKRILSVGRLKAQKNHKLLITAFAKVLAAREARLVILGTGELENETRRFIEALGLSGKVELAGHVSDTTAWYDSADLFVLSSDYEGFGNVIVEALASGLPVVATDCPYGPADILDYGRFGRLVPVGDADALADAVLATLDEPRDYAPLKRRAEEISGIGSYERYAALLQPSP